MISVIGTSGVGKTSLVHALNSGGRFALGLESHLERPFQARFKNDPSYCLANQFDFLLYRAEQERILRADPRPALIDGGLDLDFYGFTRLFQARGWLSDSEFELIRRLYTYIRSYLPPPDLFIRLTASKDAIQSRLAARDRINIATISDSLVFSSFLDEWLESIPSDRLLNLDVTNEPSDYANCVPKILKTIDGL